MKYFLLIGGFAGFVLALAGSLHAGNEPVDALKAASIGCLLGAFILRAMHAVLMSSIHAFMLDRAAAARALRRKLQERDLSNQKP
jgi:hypothetical protein